MSTIVSEDLKKVFQTFGWGIPYRIAQNRNTWLVSFPEGNFFLKRSNISPQQFELLQTILDRVRWEGYTQLLPFIHTKDGKAFVKDQKNLWYATPWKKTQDQSLSAEELVRSLARFHRLAEPMVKDKTKWFTKIDQDWIRRWKDKKEKLKEEKQKMKQKEFPSPFERSFAQNYDTIVQSLDFAIRGMEKFLKIENGLSPRYTLCHNRIHPSNLVFDEKDFYWVDFDHASLDSPVRDLALFIHRFSHLKEPKELLNLYEQEYELKPKEKRLLALYLAYPEQILKRIRVHEGITVSGELTSLKRLEKDIDQLLAIHQLVVELWPSRK